MFLSYFYLPIGYLVKTKNTTSLEHNLHVTMVGIEIKRTKTN